MARAKKAVAAENVAAAVNDIQPEECSGCLPAIVVGAWSGSEALVERAWKSRIFSMSGKETVIRTLPVDEGAPVSDTIAGLIADNGIPDRFVYVPPVCIPCSKVAFEELLTPYVYKDVKGVRHHANRLPVYIDKDVFASVLGKSSAPEDSDALMAEYFKASGVRPVEVSFKEGNFVTPVLVGTPCEHVVLEALVRKKYIVVNPVGLAAIEPLIKKALSNE